MSFLSELLGANAKMLDRALQQLEEASHKQAVDVALIADIGQRVTLATRQMGLDPGDTTGQELYYSLLSTVKKSEDRLARKLDINYNMPVDKILEIICSVAKKATGNGQVWVLKKSVAKELIAENPPKEVMKALGYRSVKSLLKRENILSVYGALRFAESPNWLNKFNKSYMQLRPTDFEVRNIEIVDLTNDKWRELTGHFVAKKMHNLTHIKELGVILILPSSNNYEQKTLLWELALLLHYINEVKLYSSFFKMQQVRKNFGEEVSKALIAKPILKGAIAGHDIHWRVIQRYFGKLDENHPEIFEPHVQSEDLHWQAAEESLVKIDPEFKFWQGLDYAAVMRDKAPISFNLLDVLANQANNLPYEHRLYYHFRESLWNEIFARYMGKKTLKDQVLAKLNDDMIMPENL